MTFRESDLHCWKKEHHNEDVEKGIARARDRYDPPGQKTSADVRGGDDGSFGAAAAWVARRDGWPAHESVTSPAIAGAQPDATLIEADNTAGGHT